MLSTWRDSNPLMPLLCNVSLAMQHASLPSLIQFLPGSFRSSLWNFHRSSLPCLMHRWAVDIFQLHRRSHPSLRSSRRHLWIHSTSATTGQFQTSPSSRSSLSVPPTSKSLDTWSVTIYSPPLQSAYQKNRSTETATIKVMSDIYRAADAGLVTLLGLLDLSAAFDTVDHVILLVRLQHHYGISGLALKWIESYLMGRSQFVRFNGGSFGHNDGHFRRPSGIGARPDPIYCIFCRSHWHRRAALLQRACFR